MQKNEIISQILKLKKEKKAIILAHYYQNDEIQAIADYIGDSFQLSKIAKNTDAEVIVFCGVHFMAETAKILSPNKKVLLPVKTAGCYMADQITYEELLEFKNNHPDYVIIGYVNTSAKVKTLCDVCVTSANALKIIKHFKDQKILYVPDKNLATYANYLANGSFNVEYWNGCCDIHDELSTNDVIKMKNQYPNAEVLVHPEARLEVLKYADYIGSTKGMIDYVSKSYSKEFIVGTELGILYSLQKQNPDKKFYKLSEKMICKTMKLTYLEDVLNALKEEGNLYTTIELDNEVINKASIALNKMLELGE